MCVFGPPRSVTLVSPWPWVAHPASGLRAATFALFRLGFPTATPYGLTLPRHATRWLIMQKVRGHPEGLPLFVGMRFQVLFHSPLGVLFTFPSRYLSTIGQSGVLSLGGWSPQIPSGFHVSEGTQEHRQALSAFAYGAVTLSRRPFQVVPLAVRVPLCGSYNPALHAGRFGLFRFRSPLLTESHLISFPLGT